MNTNYNPTNKDKSNNKTHDMKTYMLDRYKSNQEYYNMVRKRNNYIKKASIPSNIVSKYDNMPDLINYGKAKSILDTIENKEIIKDLFQLYLGDC